MTVRDQGGPRLMIIDAYGLFNRAFYALPGLTTRAGLPTGAVYGVAAMLIRLFDEERPDYVVAALDTSGPTVRHRQFEHYKEDRRPMPDDLRTQLPYLRELLEAMGVSCYSLPGYEADDIAGTLSKAGERAGMHVTLVTGDKDLLQLVSDQTQAILTRRGISETDRYDPAAVLEKLGVSPEAVPDLKGLSGDKSDSIPGVPGIGPKTAVKLLQTYGTLERLLQNIENVKGKIGKSLAEHADTAKLSKELAIIKTDLPLPIDWEAAQFRTPVTSHLLRLFEQLEFSRLKAELLKRFPDAMAALDTSKERVPVQAEGDLLSSDAFKEWCRTWQTRDGKLFITLSPSENALVMACRSDHDTEGSTTSAWVIPETVVLGNCDDLQTVFRKSDLSWLAYDAKRVTLFLYRWGITVPEFCGDLLLAGYLLDPGKGGLDLPALIERHLAEHVTWTSGTDGKGGTTPEVEPDQAARIGEAAFRLGEALEHAIAQAGLERVYHRVELPLVPVLANMEITGVRLDTESLDAISREMEEELATYTCRIYELSGHEFNINSPRQLATVLFEELGLPAKKKTKSGPSTDAGVLEELRDAHPIIETILAYRQATKLKGTYVDALPSLVNPQTGRLHTSFNQAVAATGRLSSAHPNLQNIPIRTAAGRQIRKAFVPGFDDYLLLSLDYSQIELRVLAHIAQDDQLIAAFRDGGDIHERTAAEIFDVPLGRVTSDQRSAAKAVNFGIVYGISSFGLAQGTGLSMVEAKRYIDMYFERYPKVREYMTRVVAEARKTGYVETLMGRKRWLPELQSRNWARRSFAERAAMNTPIQGSAADIMKLAMIQTERLLRREGFRASILLQVHDELLLEAHRDEAAEVAQAVREAMEGAYTLAVPLVVDAAMGPNWLDMEAIVQYA